ncbi:FimB/Mfa2 family fimbrial subunit [Massilibacteroides sp.]|uniref:FimB/Mfa2 family fimbrial subunit n=1 Tax=Massilibacteroides sp. TaxID=2034766 RepID=UPI002627271C|nr:FimB/Mfa2 family fimbrial subunit [Massilibacteroides sp.]MDD4516686.1 FimB/Mfa2 family fimbrial subunit [Massilibacteroides sp.]
MTVIFFSCIDEKRDDCGEVSVGFDYSYNILSSNAFAEQVNKVTLYMFDQNGTLVWKEASGEMNFTNDYKMIIPDPKVGEYKFVAWAQSNKLKEDDADFKIPDLIVGASVLDDLSYYVRRNSGIQNKELNNLLIGATDVSINGGLSSQHIEIPLKKVNNKIRIVLLPSTENEGLDINNFNINIVDNIGNGHLRYDYSLLRDEPISYQPYYAANVTPRPSEILSPNELQQAAVAEINVSRMQIREQNVDNIRLQITSKKTQEEIVSVNLPWFFSLISMESHKNWDLQEYLDRQDEYSITLFLSQGTWMQATIIINGWVINNLSIGM